MKKLLALLAVLGMVNVASAAITFSMVKGDTQTAYMGADWADEQLVDTYYLLVDASNNTGNFNALELSVNGSNNVCVSTGGKGTYSAEAGGGEYRIFNLTSVTAAVYGKLNPTTLKIIGTKVEPMVGQSAVDLMDPTQFSFGTQSGSPDPGPDGLYFVDSMKVAFAQSSPFSEAFNNMRVDYPDAYTKVGSTIMPTPTNNGLVHDYQFATIYLKHGTVATATLMGGTGSGDIGSGAQTIGVVSLPEPMTLSVLAIGALGLLRRKHA